MESNAYGDEEAVVSQKGALGRTTGRPEVGREGIRAQAGWYEVRSAEVISSEVISSEIVRARLSGTEDGAEARSWP